jgi:DNA-binding SARP family transcriptional activator
MTPFRLLGPVEVWSTDGPVDIGPAKQCTVLAALLVDAGSPVGVETLIDRVWDDEPPPQARRVVQAYLSRIRRMLAQLSLASPPPVRVQRSQAGYAVLVDPGLVDLHRLRRLLEQARAGHTDDTRRVGLLCEAAQLWRGDPLAGLSGSWAARVREHLRRQRLDVAVHWAQCELRLGRPAPVIDTIRPLTAEHPFAEPLAAVLMQALHADGNTAEALRHYMVIRHHLAEHLGTDPGEELQRIHRCILRGERSR